MRQPFFVTGLPRSGTAWVANLLTTDTTFCYHDLTGDVADLPSLFETVGDGVGDADSGLLFFARDVLARFPRAPWVFIDRPIDDATASLKAFYAAHRGPAFGAGAEQILIKAYHATDALLKRAANPFLPIAFDDLFTESGARAVWNHVFPGRGFDRRRFDLLHTLTIERRFDTMNLRPALAMRRATKGAS